MNHPLETLIAAARAAVAPSADFQTVSVDLHPYGVTVAISGHRPPWLGEPVEVSTLPATPTRRLLVWESHMVGDVAVKVILPAPASPANPPGSVEASAVGGGE